MGSVQHSSAPAATSSEQAPLSTSAIKGTDLIPCTDRNVRQKSAKLCPACRASRITREGSSCSAADKDPSPSSTCCVTQYSGSKASRIASAVCALAMMSSEACTHTFLRHHVALRRTAGLLFHDKGCPRPLKARKVCHARSRAARRPRRSLIAAAFFVQSTLSNIFGLRRAAAAQRNVSFG